MRSRSGVPITEAQIDALDDEAMKAEIRRVRIRLSHAPSSLLRKAFEKRLHLLEKVQARRVL